MQSSHGRGRVGEHRHGATPGRTDSRGRIAQTIRLCIEYDLQPLFDAGEPARATPQVKATAMRAVSGAINRTEAAQS